MNHPELPLFVLLDTAQNDDFPWDNKQQDPAALEDGAGLDPPGM